MSSDDRFWQEAAQRRLNLWGGALALGSNFYRTPDEIGHAFTIGPTRSGKTRLSEWAILNLSQLPRPPTIIAFDPHGHSAEELLSHYALMNKLDQVIWVDPSEDRKILAYNPVAPVPLALAATRATAKASALLAAQGLTDTESIDVMPRIKQAYGLVFQALLESQLTINEAIYLTATADEPKRQAIIRRVKSPYVRLFWQGVDQLKPSERDRRLSVLQARLHPFWATPQLQYITGQQTRSLDMAQLIESGKTIIIKAQPYRNLTVEDTRQLMAMLLEDTIAAVFSRPPHTGTPVVIFIDELADRIAGPDVAKLLRGSLKYRLMTWLGTQSLAALYEKQPELAREIMTNATTKILFRDCAIEDLELLAKEFALESLDFDEIKDEIQQTKFWPVETTRTIESYASGEGESEGSMDSQGASLGETLSPDATMFLQQDLTILRHTGEARSSGSSRGRSSFSGHSTSEVPWYEYIPFNEVSGRTFRSVEEQLMRAMQQLKRLPARHFALKQRGQPMLIVQAPFWPDVHMPDQWLEEKKRQLLSQSGLYGKIEDILAEQQTRLQSLKHESNNPCLSAGDDDDETYWQ